MTGSLEEITHDELSKASIAKNLAKYLVVNPSPPPKYTKLKVSLPLQLLVCVGGLVTPLIYFGLEKAHTVYLRLFDPYEYVAKKESEKHDEETLRHLEEFRKNKDAEWDAEKEALGLTTSVEKDAYYIVHMAGRCLDSFVYHTKRKNEGAEVIEERNTVPTKIRITPELFEKYLRISIVDGVRCLDAEYRKTVNPDFKDTAFNLLKEKVKEKLTDKDLVFLDDFIVNRDGEKILLYRLPTKQNEN